MYTSAGSCVGLMEGQSVRVGRGGVYQWHSWQKGRMVRRCRGMSGKAEALRLWCSLWISYGAMMIRDF